MDIIDKIKKTAKEKGISIAFICSKLGVGRGYLNDVKAGKNRLTDDRLLIIADVLGVSVDYLLGRTDEAFPGTKKQAAETGSLSNEDITEQVISLFRQMNARERREFLSLALHEFDEQLQEEASHDPGKSDP